ncbi:MAG: hypothetical protein K2N38_06125 [Oscillospiraceae bacterium]|nr:hypothetical protein [Oscillospiraceae bacterium]
MTVGEMRELMRRRVVPEEIVPQNIINLLMDDEDAAPPELDAFTFLTRLRGLGIGSADFMYLMEGCGAPQTVVDKIKNNPAMNLQGLILTLENSELTAEDYSRILYTARQIWERTLTLRLRKSEMVSQGNDEREDYTEPSFEEVMDELDKLGDDGVDEGTISDHAEFHEAFVTEEIEPVYEDDFEVGETVPEETAEIVPVQTEETALAEQAPEEEEHEEEYSEEEPEEEPVDAYADFAEYSDEPVYTEEIEPVRYNGDTTAIIKIDADMLKKNLAQRADESEAVRAEVMRLAAERAQQEARAAFEAARAEEAAKKSEEIEETEDDEELDELYETEESDYIEEDEIEEPDEDEKPEPFVVRIPREHRYHKGAVIAAAAGAVVVFGTAVAVPLIPEPPVIRNITYAEDNAEIFGDIYHAYYEGTAGGEKAHEPEFDYTKIFGDLLVTAEGFGTFSGGDNVYTVSSEAVAVCSFNNGELIPLDDILPPDGTRIVDAFDDKGELVTVFSGGSECGFMRISDGKALFTVRQDGFMTDFERTDGGIAIGSVYIPRFTRTFGVADAMIYMPRLGADEKRALEPQKVVPSGTVGYSYGISASYSAANGSTSSAVAVLGNPIAASVDGRFIMSGEEDMLMTVGEEITAVKTTGIQAAAFCKNGSATLEGGNINLRDRDGTVVAALVNPSQPVTSMWFEGDMLRLCGSNGVFDTRNCSDIANAKPAELKPVNGAVVGENAVVFSTGANSLTLTEYKLDNGLARAANTYTKTMQPELLATLEFSGVNTVIADGVRFGAAYRYFDGVSIMSGFAIMDESGQVYPVEELYDDRTGYTLAFKNGGNVYAQCEKGIVSILN